MNDVSFRKVNRIRKQARLDQRKKEGRKIRQRKIEKLERDGIFEKRETEARQV